MVVAQVFVATGCEFCAQLEGMISSAGLTSQVTYVYSDPGCGFGSTPGTKTAKGCFGYPSCDVNCQLNAIKAAVDAGKAPAAPATPAKPATASKTTPAVTEATPAWKTTNWANEITVDWGVKNPKPVIAETPAGWMPPDILLTPVLPLPPAVTAGITVALRDHKKMPKGRKVA